MGGLLVLVSLAACGCGPLQLLSYWWHPDDPRFEDGTTIDLPALQSEVTVVRRADGLWKISAKNERDAMRVQGYLVAADRMFQLDLFRHMARGELAALLGERQLGEKTTLQTDMLNRFLGFAATAEEMLAQTSAEERALLSAYTGGINDWLARKQVSIEHRVLGTENIREWRASDSLAIYLMLMHSLSGNADREVRRLLIACEAGLDAVEQVFPTTVRYGSPILAASDYGSTYYPIAPAVVPEVQAELASLCRQGRDDALERTPPPLQQGAAPAVPVAVALLGGLSSLSASNNWVVAGKFTASGKPVLSSDPHLPHMNPPIMWGVEIETPDNHVAGFTIPGLHRVVFGHNAHVAWGATTNHVDRQDLILHQARTQDQGGQRISGYEVEGKFMPFEIRKERFEVKGGETVELSVRFTKDGPLLNDVEPFVAGKIPLTALRVASMGDGRDLDGAARVNHARSNAEFIAGIEMFDQGCSNWVFADDAGDIGYRSPCRLPIRRGWRGTFPIPGWLQRYEWDGYVPKDQLPQSTNPERGWLATANGEMLPPESFFTAYNNDAALPGRVMRIASTLKDRLSVGQITAAWSSTLQMEVMTPSWRAVQILDAIGFCAPDVGLSKEDDGLRKRLCSWNGEARPDSAEAALYNLWSNAVLDHALADALPRGANSPTWHFVQSFPQFEAVAQWLWTRLPEDPIWDDVTTAEVEHRTDILKAAFRDALAEARRRWGSDPQRWQWGEVRPFVLHHPFATNEGFLGRLLNSPPLHVGGDNESVFKNQYLRSDRKRMNVMVGPVVRFTVDLGDPWKATYTLAGGESGWPGSKYYGNLLADWASGKARELTPSDPGPGATTIHFGS